MKESLARSILEDDEVQRRFYNPSTLSRPPGILILRGFLEWGQSVGSKKEVEAYGALMVTEVLIKICCCGTSECAR